MEFFWARTGVDVIVLPRILDIFWNLGKAACAPRFSGFLNDSLRFVFSEKYLTKVMINLSTQKTMELVMKINLMFLSQNVSKFVFDVKKINCGSKMNYCTRKNLTFLVMGPYAVDQVGNFL